MLKRSARGLVALCALGAAMSAGCASRPPELRPPHLLVAPYDTAAGDVLWAVVPPINESGASVFDPLEVGDKVVGAAAQVRGIRVLPLNRTIATMRALEIRKVDGPSQAKALAQAMGVDGVIVSTVSAYDPYDPPVMGLTLALYGRPGAMNTPSDLLFDTRLFSLQATDPLGGAEAGQRFDAPAAVASLHLDAQSHDVLMKVRRYGEGRAETGSALGWRAFTASMDLYTEFTAHEAVGELLDLEWLRMAQMTSAGTP